MRFLFEQILKYVQNTISKIWKHDTPLFSHFPVLLLVAGCHCWTSNNRNNYKSAKSGVPYIFGYGIFYKLYLLSRFFDEVVWSWVSFRYIGLKWKKPTKDVSCKCDEHRVPHSAHALKVPLIKSYGLVGSFNEMESVTWVWFGLDGQFLNRNFLYFLWLFCVKRGKNAVVNV